MGTLAEGVVLFDDRLKTVENAMATLRQVRDYIASLGETAFDGNWQGAVRDQIGDWQLSGHDLGSLRVVLMEYVGAGDPWKMLDLMQSLLGNTELPPNTPPRRAVIFLEKI